MKTNLREATEHYAVWGDPVFGLVIYYGLDWRKARINMLKCQTNPSDVGAAWFTATSVFLVLSVLFSSFFRLGTN